jgi:hypothetical protein
LAAAGGSSTSFEGQPITSGSTVVKYTLLGDTTLKGSVSGGDYSTVVANFNSPGDWSKGNFHYNSSAAGGTLVSGSDYSAVVANFNSSVSGNFVGGNTVSSSYGTAVTRAAGSTSSVLSPASVVSPSFTGSELHLEVNLTSGDVAIENFSSGSVPFTLYNIFDAAGKLLVGHPVGSFGLGSNTNEKLLSVQSGNNANTVSSGWRNYGTANYQLWSVVQDGTASGGGNGLAEGHSNGNTQYSNAITIPSGGTVDLGQIFDVTNGNPDLTFQWQTSVDGTGGDGSPGNFDGPTYSNAPVDYIGTPEPATLGLLGLGGVMMMRRKKIRAQRNT